MSVKRLFLAIGVPETIQQELESINKRLRRDFRDREIEFRFSPPENFHVTMMFFGNTEKEIEIRNVMNDVSPTLPGFSVDVFGIGAFPQENAARVIWAGIRRTKELLFAKEKVEEALMPLGFKSESVHDYKPHLTLARTKNIHGVRSHIDSFRRKSFGEIEVSELVLFESIPRGPYPEYRPLVRFPLRPSN